MAFEAQLTLRAAGSVFLASLLVLFPVAGKGHSCVNYKHKETCGLKGSSVELPCSYVHPNDSNLTRTLWSKQRVLDTEPMDLSEVVAYSGRMEYHRGGQNDCTLRLTGLRESDTSYYYFISYFRDILNVTRFCNGSHGVWLYIPVSAVSVQVEQLVQGQKVPVAEQTVTEGQRIILTCVPTCAASLNSNPAYVWYKNKLQLSGSGAITSVLRLDPISREDTGSYSCAVIGYEDLQSSAVNLTVQYSPRNTTMSVGISGHGTKSGNVTLTCSSDTNPPVHEYTWYRRSAEGEEVLQKGGRKDFTIAASFQDDDMYFCEAVNCIAAHNSTAQKLSENLIPADRSMTVLSRIFVANVGVGLVVVLMVVGALLVVKMKKRGARPVPRPPDPNTDPYTDPYTALDICSMSPDYDTLHNVRNCPASEEEDDPIYEIIEPTSLKT